MQYGLIYIDLSDCNMLSTHIIKISTIIELHIKILNNWASEASHTLGCSIKISCDIICVSTIVYGKKICMLKCVGVITYSKHVHAQSLFWEFETKCRL